MPSHQDDGYLLPLSLDQLHTHATSLGYSIENLLREEEAAKSIQVRRYKEICREDLERQLEILNNLIRPYPAPPDA